ncbi:unnamed protein product [Didymodactylos carnosus]|nr:unnamed protein product [Didymodactylos carnosus]CAF3651825.1 unnamed protein product [Didymodactylos carnosus]
MFGQRPRSDQEFWRIVKDNDIQDEEQLPTPIEDSLDQTNVGDSNTNSPAIIENALYALYPDDPQLDDTTSVAACLLGLSSTSVCTAPALNSSFFIDNLISFDSPHSKNVSHVLLAPPSVIVKNTNSGE